MFDKRDRKSIACANVGGKNKMFERIITGKGEVTDLGEEISFDKIKIDVEEGIRFVLEIENNMLSLKAEKRKENAEEKIVVDELEIIVRGKKEKPYYEIMYHEVGKEDYNIGYGSYNLENVFDWKERYFEIKTKVEVPLDK